ncbi:MAG: hypothetical protein HY014_18410 [Acidobacteria bacterium]|nr:hypothetical protein [Acidobacteriota bacterium]MBI3490112.1 hypothetical protein [Acidobacteriota bacterium]
MAKTNPSRGLSLNLSAPLLDVQGAESRPATSAYAFSTGGRFLGQATLDAKGQASFEVTLGEEPTGLRLLVGPASEAKVPDLEDLLRRGAQEKHLRVSLDDARLKVELPLPPDVWRPWLLGRCLVKGTLQKRVVRNGIAVDLPVCQATVEIYEVDPIWILIPKLPKDLLDRLREVLVRPIPIPDPGPEFPPVIGPFPGPGPDPGPLAFQAAETHRVDAVAISALHEASGSASLRFAALSGSDQAFRQALVDNGALIRPILCWLHPAFVTTRRIGTAVTDDCGHFRTTIFKSIFNPDQPDLYFRATQRLFGFLDITIYAPTPIACHTWWDYVCGSEVSLITTHPLAITCSPCPPVIAGDNWVLFMAIGNFPLSRIHGTGQALGAPTPANLGLTDGGAPWGGLLRPRLEFDNALRESLGVKYYRLSWKRDAEPDTAYKHLFGPISRHYAHMIGTDLVLDAYPLGPVTVGSQGNLFEIPPAIPPLGQWSLPDAVEDTSSGKFNTVTADGAPLLDGKVQLRVELFDAAGNAVNIGAKGIHYYVPTSTDLSGTIHTVEASVLGLVAGNTMVITLHVNNQGCSAFIAPPAIGGAVADPCCGVLKYGPGESVALAWQASHPQGFASYQFGVVRGVSSVYSSSGAATGAFSVNRSVDHLLNDNLPGGCVPGGCPVAGFSENLYVTASATDGWSRQSQYDASFVRAFVLAPK